MAVAIQLDKTISDIKECVGELQKDFQETHLPINDDNTILHRFSAKLEFILQKGQREKSTLLGTKKDYWDYFCRCLASFKGIHDGLKYVKAISELKTSVGRGRAFIRFCLMHHCLADTLQQCFFNEKVTSDWFHERSVLRQPEQWTHLIKVLYDLNDIHFDLCPRGHDLDVSWPTFARKLFGNNTQVWQPPSRSVSISSLVSFTSQSDTMSSFKSANESHFENSDIDNFYKDLDEGELSNCDFQEQLKHKEKEFKLAHNETKDKLRICLEEKEKLQAYCLELEEKLQEVNKGYFQGCISDNIDKKPSTEVNEAHKLLIESEEKKFLEIEEELKRKVSQLELEKMDLICKLASFEGNVKSVSSSEINIPSEVSDDNEALTPTESELSSDLITSAKLTELIEKLNFTEKALAEVTSGKEVLLERIENMAHLNENMKQLSQVLEQENRKLWDDMKTLQMTSDSYQKQLTEMQNRNEYLEKQLLKYESPEDLNEHKGDSSSLPENSHTMNTMKRLILNLEEKLLKYVGNNLDIDNTLTQIKSQQELMESSFHSRSQSTFNEDLDLNEFQHNVLTATTLMMKEELLIDGLQKRLDSLAKGNKGLHSHLLNLRDILCFSHCKNNNETNNENQSQDPANNAVTVDMTNYNLNHENMVFPESDMNNSSNPPSSLPSLITIISSTLNKIQNLADNAEIIYKELQSSSRLSNKLISRVQEQQMKLTGVTRELESVQNLVSSLKKEHNKLQTAEAVLKYELQEKRKLLSRLRKQMESTREEWKRARLKNSESEAEWQNLREEFAKRHKQASEESGFADDSKVAEEHIGEKHCVAIPNGISTPENSEPCCHGAEGGSSEEETNNEPQSKSRIEILEEQCKLLCLSLNEKSKNSENLHERLERLLKGASRYVNNFSEPLQTSRPKLDASESCPNLENISTDREVNFQSLPNVSLCGEFPYESEDLQNKEDCSKEYNCNVTDISLLPIENCDRSRSASGNSEAISETSESNAVNVISFQEETESVHSDSNVTTSDLNINMDIDDDTTNKHASVIASFGRHNMNRHSDSSHSDSGISSEVDQTRLAVTTAAMRRRALENHMTKLKDERIRHKQREDELEDHINKLLNDKAELEEQLNILQSEKSTANHKETDFRKRAEFIFRKERENFSNKLSSSIEKNSLLEAKVAELEGDLTSFRAKASALEAELQAVQKELTILKQMKDQEVTSLQFQLSTEALKFDRALKNYMEQKSGIADMRNKMTDQEQVILTLEEALNEIKSEREAEKSHQWQELEEIQLSLSVRDEECAILSEELRKAVAELDEEKLSSIDLRKTLEENKIASEEAMSKMESTVIQLRNDTTELKKKLIKLIKEKDILWKRTEHLSHLRRVQAADRWMDDKEANQCLGCKTKFSFTVRKHHCRLCGRIFCYSCANNWLLTTASSRQSRVCNECYIEHLHVDSTTDVAIPTVNEDSEDEDTASAKTPVFDPLIKSESALSTSSIADNESIMSLPVPETTKSCCCSNTYLQFGSAPELNCCSSNTDELPTSESFLCSSEDIVASSCKGNIHGFDIISDEEIARSLSASSPYNSLGDIENLQAKLNLTISRKTEDIEKTGSDGIWGELWLNAGMIHGVPIHCIQSDRYLHWKFLSDSKSISFSIVYKESETAPMQIVLPSLQSQSKKKTVEGEIKLQYPGIYILIFDNTFSRIMAKKVEYFLCVTDKEIAEEAKEDS